MEVGLHIHHVKAAVPYRASYSLPHGAVQGTQEEHRTEHTENYRTGI